MRKHPFFFLQADLTAVKKDDYASKWLHIVLLACKFSFRLDTVYCPFPQKARKNYPSFAFLPKP